MLRIEAPLLLVSLQKLGKIILILNYFFSYLCGGINCNLALVHGTSAFCFVIRKESMPGAEQTIHIRDGSPWSKNAVSFRKSNNFPHLFQHLEQKKNNGNDVCTYSQLRNVKLAKTGLKRM